MTHTEKIRIFEKIDSVLREDTKPSNYLAEAMKGGIFKENPFDMLEKLSWTKQTPKHHPEGNAWNHTLLVVDEAAGIRTRSKNPRVFMWAALLHDIGKPGTTKIQRNRITSYDHDKLGAQLASEFLGYFTEDTEFARQVSALVRWHMQILFVVKEMPFADIAGMVKETDIEEVALLGLCDRLGRLNVNREEERRHIQQFLYKGHCESQLLQ